MARQLCSLCDCAISACICPFISAIDNSVSVVVLQHPSEVKQSKGSVKILAKSLQNCTVIVGENFTDNIIVNQLIAKYGDDCLLMYPSEMSSELVKSRLSKAQQEKKCLILIDGTWKKAYKIFMLSKNLHQLQQCALPQDIKGHYTIRQTKKEHALSTLEACAHALILLENTPEKYNNLINKFIEFNHFKLSFVPSSFK